MNAVACQHCFCRSKTVTDDAMATVKRRVFYCCWCDEEKGHDALQERADEIAAADRAEDANRHCPRCGGSGAVAGFDYSGPGIGTCPVCKGTGVVDDAPATTKTTPQAAAIVANAKFPRGVYGISEEGTGVVHNHGSAFDAVAAALARGRDHRLYRMADGWRFVGIVHADGRFTDERPIVTQFGVTRRSSDG